MRDLPEWMTLSDIPILEFLHEHDLELTPKALYRNLQRHGYDVAYPTVRARLKDELANGFVERDENGYYELTEKGRQWVEGDEE
jgi:repressor of nif and glnA expression